MKAMKIKTQMGYDPKKVKGEINTLPSETIPDQAMSVPEMIRRSQAGLSVTGVRVPMYTGDIEIPDFDRMDISELYEFREKNERILKEYQDSVKKREDQIYQDKIAQAVEKKLRQEQKTAGRPSGDTNKNSNQGTNDQ